MNRSTLRSLLWIVGLLVLTSSTETLLKAGLERTSDICCSASGDCGDGQRCVASTDKCSLEAEGYCQSIDNITRPIREK